MTYKQEPLGHHLFGWLVVEPVRFLHGLWFDLGIWYHNADWLHPVRTRKRRKWKTVWEGRMDSVDQFIGRETDRDSPLFGRAYLALRVNFTRGIRITIDHYGPPTAPVPDELQPGRRIAIRRNGLGEYRFDRLE